MNYKYVLTFGLVFILLSFGLPKNIQKRVDKEVKNTFSIDVYDLIEVMIDYDIAMGLPTNFGKDNLFKIQNSETIIGYAYISSAPSKTADFDYLVLFDKDWVILKSKVLIYREEYGGEIGSKRWLKQFNGKNPSDELVYGDNIVAISGATISVKSMTNAVNNLLKSIKILQQKREL